ncbi:MAG: branched-chain amino acid aminotransferase [Synergistaceae bacterium]|nr:branched-chain amino acid aminotransferase [Synergistaceae bacterium]
MSFCYFNGEFVEDSRAALPLSDLAFQRGIAVFDTVRTYGSRPFAMGRHLERLAESARLSGISLPLPLEDMVAVIREGVSRIHGDSLAKPFLTAGDSEENGTFPHSRVFVLFSPLSPVPEEVYSKGLALSLLPRERELPRIKSINYMTPFCHREAGTFEPLYCPGGEITESATSSFFSIAGENLITAPDHRVLRGITREIVMEIARKNGLNVELRCLHLDELECVTEAFITGSVKEVAPVVKVGERVIGDGTPGPVTRKLIGLFRERIPLYLD